MTNNMLPTNHDADADELYVVWLTGWLGAWLVVDGSGVNGLL